MAAETPWYRDREQLQKALAKHGTMAAVSRATGVAPSTLRTAWSQFGFPELPKSRATLRVIEGDKEDDRWLVDLLKKHGDDATVEQLADAADVSPKRVRDALTRLGEGGFRVSENEDARVVLQRVAPDTTNVHPGLFDGNELRVGIVSDTHLGSKEEALDELHCAYDVFEREGITTVWHAGDLVTGRGIFRGQDSEIKVHTLDDQIDYAVENYPRRDNITTHIIAGNHDVEGEAGRVGLDPVKAVAARRDDFHYLGAFSAWLQVGEAWVHLLHGKGGMSYSYSYKAQKIVDGYPGGRKPAILVPGHWHVRGNIRARDVEVLWPGCFEWQSPFMKRLGLHPAVGFHILDITVADDGSVVRWRPEWHPFFAGRVMAAA